MRIDYISRICDTKVRLARNKQHTTPTSLYQGIRAKRHSQTTSEIPNATLRHASIIPSSKEKQLIFFTSTLRCQDIYHTAKSWKNAPQGKEDIPFFGGTTRVYRYMAEREGPAVGATQCRPDSKHRSAERYRTKAVYPEGDTCTP